MQSSIHHDMKVCISTEENGAKERGSIWISLEKSHQRFFAMRQSAPKEGLLLCALYEGLITALHQAALRDAQTLTVEDRDGRLARDLSLRLRGEPEVVALRSQARQLLGAFQAVTLRPMLEAA